MKLTIVDIISIVLLIIILGYSLIKKYINDKNGNKSNEDEIDNNTTKVGNYHFIYYYDELKEVLDKNAIFIVSDSYQFIIDEILSRGYIEFDYGDYTILKEPQK